MLSGVGPAAHLKEHGIEVVHDLPGVGENLQDHFGIDIVAELMATSLISITSSLDDVGGYSVYSVPSGPITSNVVEGGVFWDRNPKTLYQNCNSISLPAQERKRVFQVFRQALRA